MSLFAAELKKTLLITLHDPRSVLAGVIAPSAALVILFLFFGGFGSIPIGIVNDDPGPWGAQFEESILAQVSPLGQEAYFDRTHSLREESLSLFESGKLAGVLLIPPDFSDRIEGGNEPVCEYYINNYNTDFAKNMRLYLEEGVLAFYQSDYPGFEVRIDEIVSAPTQVEWIDIIAIGTLLLAFLIGGMFNYLYVFYRERQHGTMILYQAAPRGSIPSFCARIVVAALSSVLAGLVNALLILLLLGYNVFGLLTSFAPAVFLAALVYICGAAILGLFVRSFFGAIMGAMGGAMVFWFFTGGLTNGAPESGILLVVYRAFPNSFALDLMRGTAFGKTLLENTTDYAVLLAMAAVWLTAAIVLYGRRMSHRPHTGQG